MQGTLDLASHRLDAWITSFATKRLASMRASQPQGVYVGAYGWVENLRPERPRAPKSRRRRAKRRRCSRTSTTAASFTRRR